MIIGYARVSTISQNLHLQLDALREARCEKIFTEKASGAQRDRPELASAISHARQGDTIVVWKLDRLARSLKQLIETVDKLEKMGIGLKSMTESIDTTTPSGKLIFHIFACLAEFERSIIQERTTAGLIAARKMGKLTGRPPAFKDEDIQIAKALLRDGNLTVENIAKRLKVAPSTLYRHIPAARSTTMEI